MAVPSAACLPRPAAPRPPPANLHHHPSRGSAQNTFCSSLLAASGLPSGPGPPGTPPRALRGRRSPVRPPTSASPRQASNPGWPDQGLFPQEQPRAEWTPFGGSSHGGLLGGVPRGRNGRVANRTREWLSAAAPWGRPPSPLSLPHRSLSSAGPAPTPPHPSPPLQRDRLRGGWDTRTDTFTHTCTHSHPTHIYTHTTAAANSHHTLACSHTHTRTHAAPS